MNKKGKILFFCMIFVAGRVFSQTQPNAPAHWLLLSTIIKAPGNSNYLVKNINPTPVSLPVIRPGFYVTQLGFFCKQEIKLERATKIPFRFRLGSVEECDRMEGKRNALARQNGGSKMQ